ncbi:MAG TPA: hypothetical protein VK502_02295, partial [Candidatus Saccharimonadales bacterium]|nr:hypothetical protein [Candidatus Saccharimonadales bacterium]
GLGGACDANDGLKISYYKVHSTMVAKLTDQSLYTVEALTDAVGGGYQYTIGLTQDGGATHAAIGDSHCNVTPVGVAAASVAGSDAPTIIARIVFPKLTKDGAPVKEMQPVKDLIATDNYKAAVKVLESLRKE